jgi:hypothetical protein
LNNRRKGCAGAGTWLLDAILYPFLIHSKINDWVNFCSVEMMAGLFNAHHSSNFLDRHKISNLNHIVFVGWQNITALPG